MWASPQKARLAELPLTLFCVHGNHEVRPGELRSYEERRWHGGIAWVQPDYPNLLTRLALSSCSECPGRRLRIRTARTAFPRRPRLPRQILLFYFIYVSDH